ncbi:MAG: hypothetical protein K8R23_14315 [Chthoniobacter sp.]|nr:hypothetical protein [Chthoniobacter sp.]
MNKGIVLTRSVTKQVLLSIAMLLFCRAIGFSAPPDNGVPAKETAEWRDIWNPTTGSAWRTKANEKTGEMLSYNPFTSEIWRSRVTGAAEAVLREEWVNSGIESARKDAEGLLSSSTTSIPRPQTNIAPSVNSGKGGADGSLSNYPTREQKPKEIAANNAALIARNPLLGKWQASLVLYGVQTYVYSFKDDGTFTFPFRQSPNPVSGKWTIAGNDFKLAFKYPGGGFITVTGRLSKDSKLRADGKGVNDNGTENDAYIILEKLE